MTKRCLLCHLPAVDEHGLCSRVSPTHDLVRHPQNWPAASYPALWATVEAALASGALVFPVPTVCRPCTTHRPPPREHTR